MTDDDLPTRSVDSNLFITVSGPPGCGATTVCEGLSTALDCGYASGGDIFRQLADDRGITMKEAVRDVFKEAGYNV